MFDSDSKDDKTIEKSFLVGIKEFGIESDKAYEYLSELEELVNTMGLITVGNLMVNQKTKNSRFYIGSGKVEEIIFEAKQLQAECIIVDFELSPSQQRNWEKLSGLCVIDRQEVILDIFAARATTRESVLQVALARMEYSLPRLKRAWTHLSRQRGGLKGTRGEGEKQLEADKRLVTNRIIYLKKEIKEVSQHRVVQRSKREKNLIAHGAIVGYTNVGKSSLLNLLSGADILVENKLFATLDPTTRLVQLPEKQKILLTDTVGLIRKLPHKLVEAFKSTLEETVIADFLIHVLDASSLNVDEHWKTTISLLEELNASDKQAIVVYNKSDKLTNPVIKARLRAMKPDAIFISAKTGEGIDYLKIKLLKLLSRGTELMHLHFPAGNYDLPASLYKVGKVIAAEYNDDGTYITARIPTERSKPFLQYSV